MPTSVLKHLLTFTNPGGVTSSSATVEEGGFEDGSSTTLVAALAFGAARAGNDDGLHSVGDRIGHGRTRAGSGHRERPDAGRHGWPADRGGARDVGVDGGAVRPR